MMLLLKKSASEQRTTYMVQSTKAVARQVSDEQLQDAISIGEMRSLGKLQLLSSVMKIPGSLIKVHALFIAHEPPLPPVNGQCLALREYTHAKSCCTSGIGQMAKQICKRKSMQDCKTSEKIKRYREMRAI